jgi:hypothetical protein
MALAAGVTACGGSDDESPTAESQGSSTATSEQQPADREPPSAAADGRTAPGDAGSKGDGRREKSAQPDDETSDEDRVAAAVTGMYRDFAAGDAAGVCAAMSKAARQQTAQNVTGGSGEPEGDRTCAASLSKFLSVAGGSGIVDRTRAAKVEGVRIDGSVATATVSFGGKPGEIRLIREDGEWRFGATPIGPGT